MGRSRGHPLTERELKEGVAYEVVCRARNKTDGNLFVLRAFGSNEPRFFKLELEIPDWASGVICRRLEGKLILEPYEHPVW